ncbi:helix-turn-helix transcriptional regulator [Streptomyces sp. CFMR 7]|uniref:response regulator transcription factor n=1 Tax=Streptomyces sp. CFMR 7 TaxID=1649184 RepID=UPI00119DFF69
MTLLGLRAGTRVPFCRASGGSAVRRERGREGGGPPHCGSPHTPGPRCGLQRRLTIAQMAAEGLSGPAMASRLVLSVRTVNSHLQRIYAKLGIPSLHQLASELEGYRDTALPES